MPWVHRPPQPCGLEGRENVNRELSQTAAETLPAFQAAVVDRLFFPGHRPAASALGWGLPARWAGGATWPMESPWKSSCASSRASRATYFKSAFFT